MPNISSTYYTPLRMRTHKRVQLETRRWPIADDWLHHSWEYQVGVYNIIAYYRELIDCQNNAQKAFTPCYWVCLGGTVEIKQLRPLTTADLAT